MCVCGNPESPAIHREDGPCYVDEAFVPQQDVSFEHDLQRLINRYSKENLSGTPDFILAEYMQDCLNSFSAAINKREQWYGRRQDRFGMPLRQEA